MHDRAVAGFDHHLLGRFLERLKRPNPRVHVRDGHDEIQVVVIIRVGVGWQAEFLAPAAREAAPEKVADGHAVRLLVAQGFADPVAFAQGAFLAPRRSTGKPKVLNMLILTTSPRLALIVAGSELLDSVSFVHGRGFELGSNNFKRDRVLAGELRRKSDGESVGGL